MAEVSKPLRYNRTLLTVVAVFGPLATKWFQVLQRRINLPSPQRTVLGRVAADQLLFAPTMIGVFLSNVLNIGMIPVYVLVLELIEIGWNCFLSLLNNVGPQDVPLVA
jgi:protein Mpv17